MRHLFRRHFNTGEADGLRVSERRFRSFVSATSQIFWTTNATGLADDLPALRSFTGQTTEQVRGMGWLEAIHPEDRPHLLAAHQRSIAEKSLCAAEFRLRRHDGQYRWFSGRCAPIFDDRGQVFEWAGDATDIHERKTAEIELRAKLSFREAVIQGIGEGLCVCHAIPESPFVAFTVWNPRMTEITGYTMEEINRLGWYQTMYPDPDVRARAVERMSRMRRGDDLVVEEWEVTRADGAKRLVAISTRVLEGICDRVEVLALMRDITERRQTERHLKATHDRLASVIDGTNVGTWWWNIQTGETEFNERWAEIVGYTLEELGETTIRTWMDLAHPDDLQKSEFWLRRHFAGETTRYDYECRMRHKNGSWVWVHDRGKVTQWTPDGKPLIMTGTHSDITDRKRMEEALQHSQQLLSRVINNVPSMIFATDRAHRYTLINDAYARYLNHRPAEVIGRTHSDFFPKNQAETFAATNEEIMRLGAGRQFDESVGNRTMMSSKYPLREADGAVMGICGVITDITERKLAEEMQKRAARTSERLRHALLEIDGCTDLPSALASLLRQAIELGAMDGGGVYLIEGGEAVLQHHSGLDLQFVNLVQRRPMDDRSVREVLEHPGDIFDMMERSPELRKLGEISGLRHVYCIALKCDAIPFGFLNVTSRQPASPDRADIELVRILAVEAEAAFRRLALQERLRAILASMAEGVVVIGADGGIMECNPHAEELLCLPREQLLNRSAMSPLWQAVHPDGRPLEREDFPAAIALQSGQPCSNVIVGLQRAGEIHRWLNVNAEPMFHSGERKPYAVVTTFSDITSRLALEDNLRRSLHEKTVLLKEVHHRVKNNLQIVASLLRLQAGRLQHPEAVEALQDTCNRVQSMSLLHEALYSTGDFARLDLCDYLGRLCEHLVCSVETLTDRVRLERDIEHLFVPSKQAVSCGLIVNELVTNAVKYGFPGDRGGTVRVEARREAGHEIAIRVRDDGIGVPAGFNPAASTSLGLRLVENLAGQLGGHLEFKSGPAGGTDFCVRFPCLWDGSNASPENISATRRNEK